MKNIINLKEGWVSTWVYQLVLVLPNSRHNLYLLVSASLVPSNPDHKLDGGKAWERGYVLAYYCDVFNQEHKFSNNLQLVIYQTDYSFLTNKQASQLIIWMLGVLA